MFYGYLKKVCILLIFLATTIFFFQDGLNAQTTILSRTGTIKITFPDNTVLVIGKDDALPDIPSGSRVEVISGSIDIGPSAGFIQVVVGDSVATVKAGDILSASIDEKTGIADFKVRTGQVNIITGNTTTTLGADRQAQVSFDKVTGITTVKSIAGAIETVTVGVKAMIPEGAIAKIKADAKIRSVHVESVKGAINVVTIDGKAIELKEGEPMDTPGSAEGEIQTFAEEEGRFEPVEEPAEPERPEASPHRP